MKKNEPLELTDQDIADIGDLQAEEAAPDVVLDDHQVPYVPLLKVWREVLGPVKDLMTQRIEPAWANRITSQYPLMRYGYMGTYRDIYVGNILLLIEILEAEIATDENCLEVTSPEEDVAANGQHYRNLLRDWQIQFIRWEKNWHYDSKDAAAYLAAMSETHKMFFSQQGICAFLDNIKFEFTDEDQQALAVDLAKVQGE